jgi:hypothetical protein
MVRCFIKYEGSFTYSTMVLSRHSSFVCPVLGTSQVVTPLRLMEVSWRLLLGLSEVHTHPSLEPTSGIRVSLPPRSQWIFRALCRATETTSVVTNFLLLTKYTEILVAQYCFCVFVCLAACSFKPANLFSQNVVCRLCHWRPPHHRISELPGIINHDITRARKFEYMYGLHNDAVCISSNRRKVTDPERMWNYMVVA